MRNCPVPIAAKSRMNEVLNIDYTSFFSLPPLASYLNPLIPVIGFTAVGIRSQTIEIINY